MSYECLDCDRIFASVGALQSHSRAKGHDISECEECDRIFVNESALINHAVTHRHCFACNRTFGTPNAYQQHFTYSPLHRYDSDNNNSDSDYYEATDDSTGDATCYTCNRDFVDKDALNQHLVFSSIHNWCFVCSRDFSSPQALTQHNKSSAHRDRVYKCPFCKNMFKVPSSIAMHVESGCHKITRHQVTSLIHGLGIIPQISVDRRIEGAGGPRQITHYSANEQSFNGSAYECYLCHRTFRTLHGLNQHLDSPAHDDAEFRCPCCRKEFSVISALIQHIESGTCGIAKFKEVTGHFEDLTDRFRNMLRL